MALNTAGDVVAAVRVILNDNDASAYRYSEANLVEGVHQAVREIERKRPDVTVDVTIPDDFATGTSLTGIDRRYRAAIISYVAYYAELQDIEAADAARANLHLAEFNRRIGGTP